MKLSFFVSVLLVGLPCADAVAQARDLLQGIEVVFDRPAELAQTPVPRGSGCYNR